MAKSGLSDSDKSESEDVDNKSESEKLEKSNQLEISKNEELNIQTRNDTVYVPSNHISTHISILIESLIKNLCSLYEPDSKKSTMVYEDICRKLFDLNLIDESYNMTEFEGMRSEYQRFLFHYMEQALGGKPLHLPPVWPNVDEANSHYCREFDEIEYIAGGGFGQVYRVKHKLDGTEYAVKKIPIREKGIDSVKTYLSEVKTFACINHPNIVQYKAAWLESGASSSTISLADSASSTYNSTAHTQSKIVQHVGDEYVYNQNNIESFSDDQVVDDGSNFEIDFEHSISNINKSIKNRSTNDLVDSKRSKRNSISEGGKAICPLNFKDIQQQWKIQSKAHTKWATLYIQMTLCQMTLKQWLENRNNAEIPVTPTETALVPVGNQIRTNTTYEIFKQILKGLEYIHSKGIVHHDIKPSNIFIQFENGNLIVQLGDFGLACPLQNVQHSLALGTKLYAAPEQLAGKCDPKSDLYSLGIVLYELVETFRTDMERVQYITELRKGNLPSHIVVQQPQLSQIIRQLVTKNERDRPDASTLLKSITSDSSESGEIESLRCQLAEKDAEIARLRELLKSAQVKSI